MRARVVLADSYVLVGVLDDSSAIVIYVQVVWSGEDGDDRWELFRGRLFVHGVASILRLVAPYYTKQVGAVEELTRSVVSIIR